MSLALPLLRACEGERTARLEPCCTAGNTNGSERHLGTHGAATTQLQAHHGSTMDQSDTGSAGIFSRWTNRTVAPGIIAASACKHHGFDVQLVELLCEPQNTRP
eukprot:3629387-Pyramimonas_sp.AAC.1